MIVSVLQENLAKSLSIVTKAVDSSPQLPVLANVLLETEDSRLKLSATNLELSITMWIGAKVEQAGSITLPAKTFTELVRHLPAHPARQCHLFYAQHSGFLPTA